MSYVWQLRTGESRGSELVQRDIPANFYGVAPLVRGHGRRRQLAPRDLGRRQANRSGRPGARARSRDLVLPVRADLDGHSENISDSDKDFTYTRIAITALSPDGKTLLAFTTRVEPDVMLLDFER